MTLEFLGCGDAFGSGGRFQTCFLVSSTQARFLVDCGATSPTALDRRQVAPDTLDFVLLSHLHGDHFGGVPFLLLDAAYNRPRARPLVVAGPPGVEPHVWDTLDRLFPGTHAAVVARAPVRFVELEAHTPLRLDSLEVTALPVRHSTVMPCYALRVCGGGRVLAYSGDTEWTPALIDAARDADLFVCECLTFDTPRPAHLAHEILRAHASELQARRTILTHMGREMLARCPESLWECAQDGLVVDV